MKTAVKDQAADDRSYPKCEACGYRAPTDQFLERHRVRRCIGPIAPWQPSTDSEEDRRAA